MKYKEYYAELYPQGKHQNEPVPYEVCKELGIKEINARVLKGWTDDQIKEHLIKDNILRRQLTPPQIVAAGKELEKIYEGRQGIRTDLVTNVTELKEQKGRTTDLVAKDFGISGRHQGELVPPDEKPFQSLTLTSINEFLSWSSHLNLSPLTQPFELARVFGIEINI